ncbi:MAG TPA: protein kinase [Ktedonobacterales bacterium]|nr:protein kinase [Ktedonobacterales bacterium]
MQQPVPAQPPALPPGTLLGGRYLIQGYIGGGGFGHIYKAHDRVLGHRRAVKEAFYRDPLTQRQFRLEAEFILNARHANLVRGYAVFEQHGRFYLVMDYVDGYTVEEIAIQQIRHTGRPLPEAQVLDWVLPICDACHALHSQPTPIIHRDVKPANIKITRQGIPILIDLGLAKLFMQGTATIGAALAFTPGYAPPEQYQACGATDQRIDVYGLGATIFYLLTGYQPTEAPARLGAHALPAPRALNAEISPLTEAAILRAMVLDPQGRQQTAGELFVELRAARAALAPSPPAPVVAASTGAQPCTRCGTANAPTARFCIRCGAGLQQEVPERGGDAEDVAADVRGQTPVPLAVAAQAVGPAQPPASPARQALPVGPPNPPPGAASAYAPAAAQALPYATPSKLHARAPQPIHSAPDQAQAAAEAQAAIAAVLALVSVSLSFAALLAGWMLLFAAPALLLGGWSLYRLRSAALAEFRNVALAAFTLSATWPPIWMAFSLPDSVRWLAVFPLLIGCVCSVWIALPLLRQLALRLTKSQAAR